MCALVWATFETVSEDKQRWFDLFEREVGLDRTRVLTRAQDEFPGAFSTMELRQDTDVVTLLKQLCVKLAPVDCLYTASFFPTFQREMFGEVNITHLTTIPVLYNVPDLQDALFVKTYFVVGNGKKGLPFCSVGILAHELGHGVVRGQHGLIHRGESGALSESYADILGYAFERLLHIS